MTLENIKIGFAMCGSFCTFKKVIDEIENLKKTGAIIYPIMSEVAYSTDTRFGTCEEFRKKLNDITQNSIIKTVKEAEPIGPKGYLDVLVIAPCTGNTLAKLAQGIADSSVTMAAKAHLRNQKPLVLAVSTNDGLGNAAKNIGALMNYMSNELEEPIYLVKDVKRIFIKNHEQLNVVKKKQIKNLLLSFLG